MDTYESPRIVEIGTLGDITQAFRGGPEFDSIFSNPALRGGHNDLDFTG